MPHQTYLAERLQSAKGLGWDFETGGVVKAADIWANALDWLSARWADSDLAFRFGFSHLLHRFRCIR